MDRFFASLGRTVVRRRWFILLGWAVLLAFGVAFGPRLQEVFDRTQMASNPGDSHVAADIIGSDFTTRRPFAEQLVLSSNSVTVDDPAYKSAALAILGVATATDSIADLDRGSIIPAVTGLRHATVVVGGTMALEMDAADDAYSRFPLVIAISLGATFLLLVILFRSIVIPLKTVAMNLISVGAAYGLLVFAFQWGHAASLFDFTPIGAVSWMTPILLFSLLFGLSMDYEVFLLSRIRELHDRGLGNADAVAYGVERTGGVITGAALIMMVVFASFVLSPILVVKELGFGLAAAVLIDATVVRVLLVPAVMRLLGNSVWWLPGWLGRRLPSVQLEGASTMAAQE